MDDAGIELSCDTIDDGAEQMIHFLNQMSLAGGGPKSEEF